MCTDCNRRTLRTIGVERMRRPLAASYRSIEYRIAHVTALDLSLIQCQFWKRKGNDHALHRRHAKKRFPLHRTERLHEHTDNVSRLLSFRMNAKSQTAKLTGNRVTDIRQIGRDNRGRRDSETDCFNNDRRALRERDRQIL
jgi:hypothetical protein